MVVDFSNPAQAIASSAYDWQVELLRKYAEREILLARWRGEARNLQRRTEVELDALRDQCWILQALLKTEVGLAR